MLHNLARLAPFALCAALLASSCSSDADDPQAVTEALDFAWPPVVHQPYPDLQLHTPDGEPFQLASLAGQVLLIEPVGMT